MTAKKTSKPDVKAVSSAAADGDSVTIMLAHPISREQDKVYLGLDVEQDYWPRDLITVNKSGAESLIAAGIAAVDPEDAEAVRSVLDGETPSVEPSGNEEQGVNA